MVCQKIRRIFKDRWIQKPEKFDDDTLKLDSNENFVINKKFQQDVISYARVNSDIREYPLGGVEKLIKIIKISQNP